MARMLAESLSSAPAVPASTASAVVLAWLVFLALVVTSASAIPLLAWILRRRLPIAQRDRVAIEGVIFGTSQKARQSPRHAVLQHRTILATAFIATLALLLVPGIAALRGLGSSGLQVAIGLVVPTLLVALHARQRDPVR
jgi:hypothetical protein